MVGIVAKDEAAALDSINDGPRDLRVECWTAMRPTGSSVWLDEGGRDVAGGMEHKGAGTGVVVEACFEPVELE